MGNADAEHSDSANGLHLFGWLRIPCALHELAITNNHSMSFHVRERFLATFCSKCYCSTN